MLVLSATAHARPLIKTATLTSADSPSALGQSVAVSADGGTAIVGDPASAVADVFTRSASGWSAGHALASPVGSDQFGASVAVSADGHTIVVGAPGDNSAYTFTETGGTWGTANPLVAPASGQFGASVAISGDGDTILVGAPQSGNAYAFAQTNGTWGTGNPLLTIPTADQFGTSVALDADGATALVGAPGAGNADTFTQTSGTWSAANPLLTNPTADQFGTSVALDADGATALVGAPGAGNADTFTQTNGTWSAANPLLTNPTTDQFGTSVALDADGATALVGAPGAGNADTFTQTNGTWSAATPLLTNPTTDQFGTSVALDADGATALVGAPQTGNAYVFAAPAATVVTAVRDAGTGQAWSGTETTDAFAADAATITGQGGYVPTGTLTYALFGNSACTGVPSQTDPANLANGSVRQAGAVGPLHAGAHAFRATYSGDGTYDAATGPCEPFTVLPAPVTLSATSTPGTAAQGSTVILSAAGLPGNATGTIAFTTAGQSLCTTAVSAGAGSCTTPVQAPGVYPVTATYSGDADDQAGSATTTFTITADPAAGYRFTLPPSITVTQPVNEAHYTREASVRADFGCVDGSNAPGISTCDGTVPRGAPIDTSTVGPHGFTVTAMSRSGASTVRTIHYVVVLASNQIVVAQPDLRPDGRGTIDVTVPGPGRLTVVETAWPAHRREPRAGRQALVSLGTAALRHAGTVTVPIHLAAAGRRLLQRSRGQRLRIRLAVTFAPTGGVPAQLAKYGLLRIAR